MTEKKHSVTLGTLLNMHFETHDLWNKTGRTKQYVIKMLMDCDIANILSDQLKVSALIDYYSNRRDAGAGPATIYHDIAFLRSVMKEASPIWNIEANHKISDDAVPVLLKMDLVGKNPPPN